VFYNNWLNLPVLEAAASKLGLSYGLLSHYLGFRGTNFVA